MTGARRAAALAIGVLVLSGCAAVGDDGAAGGEEGDRTVTVLAAASLTESFTELAALFESEHPGVRVRLAFGSSATLAGQVAQGAPADVLVTADERSMVAAREAGVLAEEPVAFARNSPVLVTPAGNPAGVTAIDDLDDPGVTWVACVRTAPCGLLAHDLLTRHAVTGSPASEEVDVKAVLARVVAGEADAGIVYRTDAAAAGDRVHLVEVPGASALATTYLVAPVRDADEPALARAFVAAVTAPPARALLGRAGFAGPPR